MIHTNLLTRIKGFTLIEIIVVIVIVSAMTALSLPRIFTVVERFRASEGEHILLSLLGAQKKYFIGHNNTYADNLSDLDIVVPASRHFNALTDADISAGDPIARIVRTNSYTLSISGMGVITCTEGASDPANLCDKIGH